MMYQDKVSVVMQFAVADHMGAEDGFGAASGGKGEEDVVDFDAKNHIHVQALEKLFAMIMFFIEKWWPSAVRLFPFKKKLVSKFHNYVEFKKLMQPGQWKQEMESYAVLIIQRFVRRNKL